MLQRIIPKLNFIKKLPRNFAKPILITIIISDEIFWSVRIFLFTLFFGKKNKIGKALIDLKKTGVAIMPNLYSKEETSRIKEECIKQLDKLPFDKLNDKENIPNLVLDNGMRVEKIKGSIKLKGLNTVNLFFKKIGRNLTSNLITLIYQLTLSRPFLIYHVVHDGSFNHPAVSEPRETEMIAGDVHIDLYNHHLRCGLVLDDIDKDNGPTVCYKSSMHLSDIKKNHLNLLLEHFNFKPDKGGSHLINEEKLKILEEKTDKFYVTGKKGDFVLLDLKSAHYHSYLNSGQRHVLWHFYH